MKIIDMHCDTATKLLEAKRQNGQISLRKNQLHIDLVRMRKSGYLLQNFALAVDIGKTKDPWDEFCQLYHCLKEELESNSNLIAPVFSFKDIENNEKLSKMSALITVEDGAVCGGDCKKLNVLYKMGVRMVTLTWNYPNEIGFPNLDYSSPKNSVLPLLPNTKNGLSEKGIEIVNLMENLGIIIDVSHLSDKGFYDVWNITKKPFVASHSNARSVCGHIRNLTDDMLKKLSQKGGCAGLNFYPPFLTDSPENTDTVSAVVEHAKHITNCAGIDVLALGSDFDGISGNAELKGAESIPFLYDTLHKAGFNQSQLDKIFYGNALRVYKEILK